MQVRVVQKKRGWPNLTSPALSAVSIMSQNKIPGDTSCVPVSHVGTQGPNGSTHPEGSPSTTHHIQESHPAAGVPVTAGPYDVWHDEAYLIGWLVRCHGWRVVEPGLIRRSWQPERSVTAPQNRQAAREALAARRGA
jgi:hypothetical protein